MTAQTKTNNTAAASNLNSVPEAAHKVGEQLISAVKQGQNLTLDAARALAKATSTLPALPSSDVLGANVLPDIEALTSYGFDLAIELLTAQRDFAVKLAAAFAPAKTA